jgi:hypothetical protein
MKLSYFSLISLISLGIGSANCNFEDDSESPATPPTLTLSLSGEIYDESGSLPATPPPSPDFSDSSSSSDGERYRLPPSPRPLKRQNAGFWNPEQETFDQWHQRLLVLHPAGPGNRGAKVS